MCIRDSRNTDWEYFSELLNNNISLERALRMPTELDLGVNYLFSVFSESSLGGTFLSLIHI